MASEKLGFFRYKKLLFHPISTRNSAPTPALFNAQVAHLSGDSILVDDFTLGHEKEEPSINAWFMDQLAAARSLSFQSCLDFLDFFHEFFLEAW